MNKMVWFRHIDKENKGCSFESQENIIPSYCQECKQQNVRIVVDIPLMIAKQKFPQDKIIRDGDQIKTYAKTREEFALCVGQELLQKQKSLFQKVKSQQINLLFNEELCQILYKILKDQKLTNVLASFINNTLVLFYFPLKLRVIYFIDVLINNKQRQIQIFQQNIFIISEDQQNYHIFKIDIDKLNTTRLQLLHLRSFSKMINEVAPQLMVINNNLHLLAIDNQQNIDMIWQNDQFIKQTSLSQKYFYIFSNQFMFKNEDQLLFVIQSNKLQIYNEHYDNSFTRNKEIGTVLMSKGYAYDIQKQIQPQIEKQIRLLEIRAERGILRSSEQEYSINTDQDFTKIQTTVSTAIGYSEIVSMNFGQQFYPAVLVLVPAKKSIFIEIL